MNSTRFWRLAGWSVAVVASVALLSYGGVRLGADRLGGVAQGEESDANKDVTLLPIHAFQQTTGYTCGPSALLTLLRHHGRDSDEMQIAKEAKCSPEKGTTPENMAAWLREHDFEVTWGEGGSLKLLREQLAKGLPTIVEWIDWGGHWVIVVGYDTRGTEAVGDDEIIFADPADEYDGKRDGLTSFNALRFEYMWFDAFLFDRPMHKVYITAVPKGG